MSRQLEPRSPAALLHSPAAAPRCRSAPSKRLLLQDAAEEAPAAAKCARLAVDYSSAAPQDCLSAPGSPCASAPPAPGGEGSPSSSQGPSLIAGYLLLPLLDREHVSRALDINTGRELRCKVSGRPARRDLGAAPVFRAWNCGRGSTFLRGRRRKTKSAALLCPEWDFPEPPGISGLSRAAGSDGSAPQSEDQTCKKKRRVSLGRAMCCIGWI